VVGVASLIAAGCASQTDEGNTPATGSGECPAVGTKPASQGEVTYWSMWTQGEPQQQVLQAGFDCFTKETGTTVKVQWLGRKMLTQNVAPALNTDNVPDLIDQDISQITAAVGAPGGLADISDVMGMKNGEGDKTVGDVIDKKYWDFPENTIETGQVLVPYELLTNAWWYNKDQVKDFKKPETTEDLFALFDASKQAGRAAVSQDGDIDFYNAYFFTQWAEKYVGAGGILKAARDKSGDVWKSDASFLKAAQLVEKLGKGGYLIDGWDANKFPNIQNQWADGKSDYLFVGSWVTSEASEYLKKAAGGAAEKKLNFGSFPMPMPEGATHQTVEQMPIGFALTKKAKNPEGSKALVAYMTNKANIEGFSSEANNLVPRADVDAPAELADVKAALDDPKAETVIFMDSIDGAEPDWTKEVFYPLNNSLLKGQITGQQFVDQISAKSKAFWANK
jgi:raffinose/stachyose/melibiose transport system substrate-binding protein